MATADVLSTHLTVPSSKDSHHTTNSNRLLSKLTRSPTSGRKHKNTPSVNSSGSDSVPDQLPSKPPSSHSQRNQIRPDLPRNTSAPIVPTIVNPSRDNSLARTYSDNTEQQPRQINTKMLDPVTLGMALKPPGSSSGKTNTPDTAVGSLQVPPAPQVASNYHYQQLYDLSNKRIATLDYMRKSHEGQRFWFNTVQFSKSDISRLPSYTPSRLARRAQNYLLLGLSIPAVLDVHPQPHPNNTSSTNSAIAVEFLRSLNTLLTEFDSYQQLHPLDGSHVSSLTRARIPQMFKRAATTNRPRKSSGAIADIGQSSQISPPALPEHPQHGSNFFIDTTQSVTTSNYSSTTMLGGSPASSMPSSSFSTSSSFPPPGPADAPNSTCLPNEGPYTHLLTPPLPFAPDFYIVFATLCDVLIDVYQRLLQIINAPSTCNAQVTEAFSKADARIRKVMVGGVVRDFETQARESAKRELMGVQKIVLGGLMGV